MADGMWFIDLHFSTGARCVCMHACEALPHSQWAGSADGAPGSVCGSEYLHDILASFATGLPMRRS
jgi:hypothetical protein